MYDDYDLDYTYAPSYEYDLDETYDAWVQSFQLDEDLDEEYTRDAQDYYALAYKHYAWYTITHTRIIHAMYATKRTVRVTLDIECYDDLELESFDWNDILGLEGDEQVQVSTEDVYERW